MTDLFENPMGLNGFEFVEFAAQERGLLEDVFTKIGFSKVARHRSKDVDLWRQGGINFIINYEKKSHADYYAQEHGGALLYLIDRYEDGESIYDIDFDYLEGVDPHPEGHGFQIIDHLTHNVYGGRMDYWADYYERLFNFREIRYFDIKGEYTGLLSRVSRSMKKAPAAKARSRNSCASIMAKVFSILPFPVMTFWPAATN